MGNQREAHTIVDNDPKINQAKGVQEAGGWSHAVGVLAFSGSSIWAYSNPGETISVTPMQGDALIASFAVFAMGIIIKELGHGMEGNRLKEFVEQEKKELLKNPA